MRAEIKFCGLMRPEDAAAAAALGAAYAGVIFAGGPRALDAARARETLGGAGNAVRRVGVFGAEPPSAIAERAREVELDVVQLHGDPSAATIDSLRAAFAGAVWAVLRLDRPTLPAQARALADAADAIVLDSRVAGALGGTGVALDWRALDAALDAGWDRGAIVLAGGLRASNVAEAVRVLRPAVVDVSSGVETAPGIKDHAQMRAFRDAVRDY